MPFRLSSKPSRFFRLDGWWLREVIYRDLQPLFESKVDFFLDPYGTQALFALTDEGIECQVDLEISPLDDFDLNSPFPDDELVKSLLLGLFDYFFEFNEYSVAAELKKAAELVDQDKSAWLSEKLGYRLPINSVHNYMLNLPCSPSRVDEFMAHFGMPNRINVSISHSDPVDRSIGDRQVAWSGHSETFDLYSRYSYVGGLENNSWKRSRLATGDYLERLERQFWELEDISYTELHNYGDPGW